MIDNSKSLIELEVAKLLFRLGFEKSIVKLAQKTNSGQEEIICYKYGELYCLITITPHPHISGKVKDWVLIEYADSLYEAERWMFGDGDMIPLDIPIEQILSELESELLNAIDGTL